VVILLNLTAIWKGKQEVKTRPNQHKSTNCRFPAKYQRICLLWHRRIRFPDQMAVNIQGNEPSKVRPEGVWFVAWRTENHRSHSTCKVLQGIVDELLLFLKENRLKPANDNLGRSLRFEKAISTYEATTAAKKAGGFPCVGTHG
jgi:hypothetical protein